MIEADRAYVAIYPSFEVYIKCVCELLPKTSISSLVPGSALYIISIYMRICGVRLLTYLFVNACACLLQCYTRIQLPKETLTHSLTHQSHYYYYYYTHATTHNILRAMITSCMIAVYMLLLPECVQRAKPIAL